MFKVHDKPILTPIYDILIELRNQLQANNKFILAEIKKGANNVQVSCPFHNNGQERRPSAGISTVDRKIGDKVIPAGTFNCFTCHESMPFVNMISLCFGYNDGGRFGSKWILKNFIHINVEKRDQLQSMSLKRSIKVKDVIEEISDDELDKYRYIHPYMYERKLTDEIIEKFDIGYNKEKDCLTFPIWNEKGVCVFVGERGVKSKFFHYPAGTDKPVYLLNFITPDIKEVYVCESFINALTCWTYGKPAISLIGTGSYSQYEILRKSHIRKFVLALDPDKAGRMGTKRFRENVNNKLIVELDYLHEGKDINEISKEEFLSLQQVL